MEQLARQVHAEQAAFKEALGAEAEAFKARDNKLSRQMTEWMLDTVSGSTSEAVWQHQQERFCADVQAMRQTAVIIRQNTLLYNLRFAAGSCSRANTVMVAALTQAVRLRQGRRWR